MYRGIYYFFLFLLENIDCGYSVLAEAVLMRTDRLCFEQKYEKSESFLSENFQFLEMKFSIYLNRRVSVVG